MGTEDWIFKCIKLISNTRKQRLKIQSRGQTVKNTILKKTKTHKKILEIYMKFGLKIGLLFFVLQGYSEMKMKIKGQQRSNRGLYKKIREKEKKENNFFPN